MPSELAACLDTLRDGHEADRWRAVDMLIDLGPAARPAVPELLRMFHGTTWTPRGELLSPLSRIAPDDPGVVAALVAGLDGADPQVREDAAYAAKDIPEPPDSLVLALANRLGDKRAGHPAAYALLAYAPRGRAAIPAMIEHVKADGEMDGIAMLALAKHGEAAKAAVPVIVKKLSHEDKFTRDYAARALVGFGKLAAVDPGAEQALIAATRDPEQSVRFHAALALGRMGAKAPPVSDDKRVARAYGFGGAAGAPGRTTSQYVAALIAGHAAAPTTADISERLWLSAAIESVGTAAFPALSASLASADPKVRQSAATELGSLARDDRHRDGPGSADAVIALIRCTADDDPIVRDTAVVALGGFRSKWGLSPLRAALRHRDWNVRSSAAVALRFYRGTPQAGDAIGALVDALRDPNRMVRYAAANTLGEYGHAARAAVPRLIELVDDRDTSPVDMTPVPEIWNPKEIEKSIRSWTDRVSAPDGAVKALGKIGPAAGPAATAKIVERIRAKPGDVRAAVECAGAIGPNARSAEAVATIRPLLADKELVFSAADALGRLGAPGVAALIEALGDEKTGYAAWSQLGRVGPSAVPALVAAIADGNEDVARDAALALDRVGPRAVPVLEKIVVAPGTPARQVELARSTLKRIRAAAEKPPAAE